MKVEGRQMGRLLPEVLAINQRVKLCPAESYIDETGRRKSWVLLKILKKDGPMETIRVRDNETSRMSGICIFLFKFTIFVLTLPSDFSIQSREGKIFIPQISTFRPPLLGQTQGRGRI